MMKIELDRAKCIGLGICESIAPDVFEVDDDGDLVLMHEQVGDDALPEVEEAVRSCPAAALRLARE